MRHVISSISTFQPSIIKIFESVFKLQSGQEVLRGRRRRYWHRHQRDPSQKQYAPPPFGGGGGGRASLRKHAYSNILKISPPKTESFQIKILIFFHISAQNIDCWYSLEPPRRGDSNKYPLSLFLSRNKKNNIFPCKSQFYHIKVGFKGVEII